MGAILAAIRTFGGGLLERGTALATGLSLRTWLYILGAVATAVLIWLAYSWAWNRGADHQKEADGKVQQQLQDRITILTGDVETLTAGIKDANARAEAAVAREKTAEAEAAAAAARKLADVEAARRREAARGAGADQMNAFFAETFGGAK